VRIKATRRCCVPTKRCRGPHGTFQTVDAQKLRPTRAAGSGRVKLGVAARQQRPCHASGARLVPRDWPGPEDLPPRPMALRLPTWCRTKPDRTCAGAMCRGKCTLIVVKPSNARASGYRRASTGPPTQLGDAAPADRGTSWRGTRVSEPRPPRDIIPFGRRAGVANYGAEPRLALGVTYRGRCVSWRSEKQLCRPSSAFVGGNVRRSRHKRRNSGIYAREWASGAGGVASLPAKEFKKKIAER
jgi:hypothetical protein